MYSKCGIRQYPGWQDGLGGAAKLLASWRSMVRFTERLLERNMHS